MTLIVGYSGSDFITQDPGTRYGEHYRYNQDLLVNAIHDLTDPESNGANGQSKLIEVID